MAFDDSTSNYVSTMDPELLSRNAQNILRNLVKTGIGSPVYTFGSLPLPGSYIGNAFVADVGLHGSLWRSDGVSWGLVGGQVVVADTAVASSPLTGTTTETVAFTYTIPPGLLGLNGSLLVEARRTHTNSANAKTGRVRLGGLAGASLDGPQVTAFNTSFHTSRVQNRNAANSQIGGNGALNLTASANAFSTSAVDTSVAQDLVYTLQLANSGESITLESIRVILVRP
jgi:hypothetical protein